MQSPGGITYHQASALGAPEENAFESGAPSAQAWWYVIPPGLCITVLVLAVSMLGYLFEEHVNPRLRENR